MTRRNLKDPKRFLILVLVLAVICVAFVLLLQNGARAYKPPKIAFDGASDDLEETVIVPTLDTPMPKDKNVIWCASFQIAWNEMRDEIVGEPIRIKNAEEITERLNNAKSSKDDLEPGSYYVKAGAVADGVIEQIQREMAARSPDAPTPQIEASLQAFVAYAYLAANVKFTIPFFENDERFLFDGVPVSSFGIRDKDGYAYGKLRSQVEVLYLESDEDEQYWWYDDPRHDNEFAIDPCKDSSPYQLILARVTPEATLAETVAELEGNIAAWNGDDWRREFETADVLLVPNVFWRIKHHFRELEGTDKRILNEDCPVHQYWVSEASEMIDFRLDRSGGRVAVRGEVRR